jgi:L-alanine-DL-glutamate epimerase-like enolase superfamily enzyme
MGGKILKMVNSSGISKVAVSSYTIPTDLPESDGTIEWDSTTLVLVEVTADGQTGIGFSYADTGTACLIRDKLAEILIGLDPLSGENAWIKMVQAIRNLGRPGIASMAISAVDFALWDLKAKILNLPLISLFGEVHKEIPVYGSGGFTSYTDSQLTEQFQGWADSGIKSMKMKIGREAEKDFERVKTARAAIGSKIELFVDANGAYNRKQALNFAEKFAGLNVKWFEEPVSSDDLEGLHLIRNRAPSCMNITAGEYGYDIFYFKRMLCAGAVDVLQADATRCGGFTGFREAAALCSAFSVPLSAHTAPTLHATICCSVIPVINIEYFFDHARIEKMFFDGALVPQNGMLKPDKTRAGLGIEFKRADAGKFETKF